MERKTIASGITFKASDTGEFEGYGSTFGAPPDSEGDIVDPGAFAESLPAFKTTGFIGWGHDWKTPIAMPVDVHEDSHGLYVRGRFHSTPDAQNARTIVAERVGAGLSYGLSIGFQIARGGSKYDADNIRHLSKLKLHEVSLVSVPANSRAVLLSAKAASMKDGRVLSAASRSRLSELRQAMADGIDALDAFLAETEHDPVKAAMVAEYRRFRAIQARR